MVSELRGAAERAEFCQPKAARAFDKDNAVDFRRRHVLSDFVSTFL